MAKKVENKDLFADDLMGKTIKDVELLIVELDKLEAKIVTVAKTQKTILEKEDSKSIGSIQRITKAVNELSEAEKIQQNLLKQKQTLETKLKSARTVQAQQNAETNLLLQQQNKIIKDAAKESLGLTNAYTKLTAQTNKAQANFKKLAAEFGVNSKQAKAAKLEFDKLDNRLRSINNAANDGRRDVGRYGLALSGLGSTLKSGLGALGITAGIAGVAAVVGNIVGIFKDFEQANSKLKSVLGANALEMENLKTQAIDLGAASAYTSTQVTELQTEFAKLGFPTKDILNMTASTLAAASAMGSELGEQAALTGATIKAFGLKSRDAARVNDVLALSTSRSALDFSKLSASMSTIAPVASKLGFGLEDTVALLGNLSDSGFDASSAATATRNIFLKLADSSSNLGKRLKEPVKDLPSLIRGLKQLKQEGIDLGGALELTDDRSVAAFATFLSGTDSLEKLSAELNNATGAAQRMADTMLDNLAGDIEAAGGAWEGFILGLENGDGVISKVFRRVTQTVTDFLGALTKLNKTQEQLTQEAASRTINNIKDFGNAAATEIKTQYEKIGLSGDNLRDALLRAADTAKGLREEALKRNDINMAARYSEERLALINMVKEMRDSNDDTTTTTELTKEQTDALKKRNDELERYKRQLRDSQVNLLDDDLKQSIERIKNKFNDEIELVKGNSKIEIELRKSLELEKLQAVDEVIEKYKIKSKEMKKADDLNLKIRTDLQNVKTPSDILEEENKKIEEQMRVRKELTEAGLQIIEDLVNNYYEKQLTALDKQLDKTGERVDYLRGKAQNSMLASEESLAFEQKKEAELEQQRIKTQKEQQKMQALMTVISTYNSKVNANDPTPLQSTIRDLGVLRALAGTLQGFYEGTDDVGKSLGKPQLSGKDGHIIRVDGKEQIWSAKDRAAVGFRDRDEIKDIVSIFDNGILNELMKYDKSNEVINPSAFAMNGMSIKMISKLEQISENIKGIKIPEGTVSIDEVKKLITLTIKNGNTIKKERSKLFD